jgi:hypothetical protein
MKRTPMLIALAAVLASCGGGGGLGNPDEVDNPSQPAGQRLSFVYFQKCVDPILQTPLPIVINGVSSVNSCAGGGCHDSNNGTGGALRVVAGAATVPLADLATPDLVRLTDMYKNFYSAQGSTVPASPSQSRLLTKPLVDGVLHGGGLIFASADDANARRIRYWINRPMPEGQDEFSSAAATMFTPADPATGACNDE